MISIITTLPKIEFKKEDLILLRVLSKIPLPIQRHDMQRRPVFRVQLFRAGSVLYKNAGATPRYGQYNYLSPLS